MKEITIKRYEKGELNLDENAIKEGISIALVDEQHIPIARYEFSSDKLANLTKLFYDAKDVRLLFYGDIKPTMMYECTGL